MADPVVREDFVLQAPEEVAQAEAGMHTLAVPSAGVSLGGADAYGLIGRGQGPIPHRSGALPPPAPRHDRALHPRPVGHRLRTRRALLAVQLHDDHQQPERPPIVGQPLRHELDRERHVRPGDGGGAEGHRDRPDRCGHRHPDRRDRRRHRRLLPGLGRLPADALRGPRAGAPGARRPHPALEQARQAVQQLAGTGGDHRDPVVDLRRPVGASGLLVAPRARLRRSVARPRRHQPAHHRQAHVAQRRRADHRQRRH